MALDVECHRCGYTWKYTGSSEYYASCPQCKTSVPIEEGDEKEQQAGSSGSDVGETEGPGPDGGDLDALAGRIEELESTASGLHEAIETMMARVTDLEKRHDAIATVGDGGTVTESGGGPRASETPDSGGSGGGDPGGAPRGDADGAGASPSGRGTRRKTTREPTEGGPQSQQSEGRTSDGRRRPDGPSGGERSDDRRTEKPPKTAQRGAQTAAEGLEPIPDDEGNYDYLCPSCDGSLSGRPDVCLHCGASFSW